MALDRIPKGRAERAGTGAAGVLADQDLHALAAQQGDVALIDPQVLQCAELLADRVDRRLFVADDCSGKKHLGQRVPPEHPRGDFHLGGVASAKVVDQSSLESNFDGTVKIKQRNVVKDSQGRLMVMGRNTAVVEGTETSTTRA